ncbi:MAG: hypothetical protein ACOYOI_01315 [Chthoniobacterales bacterium]
MSRGIIPTHAGDDSDGKIWGVEGVNILFLLAAGVIGIGLAMMLSKHHTPMVSVAVGGIPLLIVTLYVFTMRQGKPKSFDTDLIETLALGNGWTAPKSQPRSPLHPIHPHAGS